MATDWLDEIEAQADETSPYYLPKLIGEIRRLRREAADALRAAGGPEPGRGGWQPIATAPKTHDGLLLTDGRTVSQGGWLSQCDQGADYEGQSCAPSAGWWSVDCIEPTHWQPLPAPPTDATREG